MKAEFAGTGLRVNYISAYDGHDKRFPFYLYGDLAGQWWDRLDVFKPGAFGCFLSHARVWSRVALGLDPYAAVFEDDVEFDFAAWSRLLATIPLAKFDFIFINDRMQRWVRYLDSSVNAESLISLGPLLCDLITKGIWERPRVPGADAYIVSRPGACKLLYMMHSRKINMGIDFAMLLNTLNERHLDLLDAVPNQSLPRSVRIFLSNERRRPASEAPVCLNGYFYTPAWVAKHRPVSSTIVHDKYLSNEVFSKVPNRWFPSRQVPGCRRGRL